MRTAERTALARINYDLFAADPEEEFRRKAEKGSFFPTDSDLGQLFDCLNRKYFNGILPKARVEWSSRMKHAGTCYTKDLTIRLGVDYHRHYPEDIVDTLKHEMIHIRLPNHGRKFQREAERLGTSLHAKYYPGMLRGMKYVYVCPACGITYPTRKMLRNRSCGACSKGRYDGRFKLKFLRRIENG